MRITYYDLETTGLDPVRNDIIQVALATFDNDKCVRSEVMHFFYEGMTHSSPEALEKHGMTYEYLSQFKDEFERNCHRTFAFLANGRVCGFNNHMFDDKFISVWLNRNHAPDITFKESIDVMKLALPIVNKQRISLLNLRKHFNITDDDVNAACKEWFGTEGQAHLAHFDVAATRLCHLKEIEIIEEANKKVNAEDISSLARLCF